MTSYGNIDRLIEMPFSVSFLLVDVLVVTEKVESGRQCVNNFIKNCLLKLDKEYIRLVVFGVKQILLPLPELDHVIMRTFSEDIFGISSTIICGFFGRSRKIAIIQPINQARDENLTDGLLPITLLI